MITCYLPSGVNGSIDNTCNLFIQVRNCIANRTLESATGLSVDFEMSFQDSMVKDMVDQVFQGLPLDIPSDIDTQPFYQDDQKYGAGHFVKGQKTLSGIEVMQFMKTLPQN